MPLVAGMVRTKGIAVIRIFAINTTGVGVLLDSTVNLIINAQYVANLDMGPTTVVKQAVLPKENGSLIGRLESPGGLNPGMIETGIIILQVRGVTMAREVEKTTKNSN